jgi:hypothetical protein
MRDTTTQSGKGFKLQTLRAIDIFLDAILKNGRESRIYIATEKIGDIYCQINNENGIEEVKNYSTLHSINSDAIKNTLINFIDIHIHSKSKPLTFSFYSTAGHTESDNKNLEYSILYYLKKGEFTNPVIANVKEIIVPYYEAKYKQNTGFIAEIKNFSDSDWQAFLAKINWQFSLHGNQELSEIIKNKCRKVIEKIEPSFLSYNGFETSVIHEFREQLEKKLEENQHLSDFEFKDFEIIVVNEYKNRTLNKQRDYGKFMRFADYNFPIEPTQFFFTNNENQLIDEITSQFLYSDNRNFILLSGKSAQGKTILSRQIASELDKHGFLTLFLEINANTNFQDLNLKDISKENSLVFCLLSKVHLNISLINEILLYQEKYKNVKFIFESRIIDKTIEQDAEELFNHENLEEKKLDFKNDTHFKEKYLGILRKYTTNNLDINQLIKATGRNFLFLTEYLKSIDVSSLSGANFTKINELVLNKYKHRKYDGLKEFAIINQYEIPIKYGSLIDKADFEELIRENELICTSFSTEYYNLYHSDFAKLITESFLNEKGLNSYQIKAYEILTFSKYLANTDYLESPIIFNSLYANSGYKLLKGLLSTESIKNNFFKYYSNPDNFILHRSSSKPLRDLLRIIPEVSPEIFPEYLQSIIIENERLNDFFTSDSSFIFTLINISAFIKKYLPNKFEEFNTQLPRYFSNTFNDIPFSAITLYLNEAKVTNSVLFEILKEKFPIEYLSEIIYNEEFLSLTEGVLLLYKLRDCDGFIEKIKDLLISKSQKTTLNRFSKGLQNIKRVSSIKFASDIFESYPNELLKKELRNSDIRNVLKTVNVLIEFGYDKIYRNFQLYKFNNGFKQYNYIEISNILLEVDKFLKNRKLSNELINSIDVNSILEKISKSNPYFVAQSFLLLSKRKGYREYIEKIYYNIPVNFFEFPKEKIDFFKIIETLHWLKLIDESGIQTNKCWSINDEIINNFDYASLPYERLVLIFTKLKGIDFEKTKKLLEQTSDIIKEKVNKNEYKEIGITLSRLANIDSDLSFELLNQILSTAEFLKFIEENSINIISRTLKEMQSVENVTEKNVVNEFYLKIKNDTIISSIQNVKFDVICHSLNEFLSIETEKYKRTRKLIWDIGFEPLKLSINDTPFIGITSGFISLFKVNRKFASELFNYSENEIIRIASISELDKFSDGLKALSSLNSSYAEIIFKSPIINLGLLASESNNYSLDAIKRCLFYLKSIDKPRTKELLLNFDATSLSYKFKQEKQFDKAAELLNQISLIEKTKIIEVINNLGEKEIYNKCKDIEIKIISKGLREVAEIDRDLANRVLSRIWEEKDILNEIDFLQFDVLGKTIREISKIELKPILSKKILSHLSHFHVAKKATKMSKKQLSLGFGALKQVDMTFSIIVAKKLVQLKPETYNTIKRINKLID